MTVFLTHAQRMISPPWCTWSKTARDSETWVPATAKMGSPTLASPWRLSLLTSRPAQVLGNPIFKWVFETWTKSGGDWSKVEASKGLARIGSSISSSQSPMSPHWADSPVRYLDTWNEEARRPGQMRGHRSRGLLSAAIVSSTSSGRKQSERGPEEIFSTEVDGDIMGFQVREIWVPVHHGCLPME